MDPNLPQSDILLVIFIGILLMLLLALAFVLFFYFSQRKFQAQQLRAQQRELKHQEQLLFASIQAQESERQRLARELHDEVGSKLNVINLGLHRLKKAVAPARSETVQELFGVVGITIDTTRRIAHELLPPTLEKFGLAVALEELCEQYRQASDKAVTFELKQEEGPEVDDLIALHLFRVAQELISNSFKYSEASYITFELWQSERGIKLVYKEDGKGFDPQQEEHQKGLGLQNIESRMRLIGADYKLESAPGKGVLFSVHKQLS